MDAARRKKIIIDYYDNYAKEYGKEYETTLAGRYFLQKKIKIANQLGNFPQGAHILDAGCANGYYTLHLARQGYHVTGIDLSEKNIKECTNRAAALHVQNVVFHQADLENLKNFKDNQFDGVISFATLRYVPDVVQALKELYRVTKKGGTVIVDFPNKNSPWFLIFQRFAWKYILPQDKECDLHYTIKEAKTFMEKAAFHDITIKIDFWIARTTPTYIAPPFIALDIIMSHTPCIKNLGGAIMLKGVK